MADTVRVTKLGRGRRGGRRGRNTLRSIGARDVDKERTARIAAKEAEKLRAKNDPKKKVRKTSAQRFRAGQDEKAKQIRKVTNEKTRLQQTLAGVGAAAGMLGGPLAKVVGAGGKLVAGKVASVAAKKAAEKATAAAAKKAAAAAEKKAAAAATKKAAAAAKRKAAAAARKKAADAKKKADAKRKQQNQGPGDRPVPMNRNYKKTKRGDPKLRDGKPILKPKPPKAGKGKGKGKGKGNKAAVTAATTSSKNIGKKLGIGAGIITALGTGAYMGGRKPSDAKPPKKPDNKIDFSVDDEDRIVEQGRTITSNPKGDGSRTGLDLETLLSRIEDREYAQDPEDVQHDLADLRSDLKELRGYRRGGPVRKTNQFKGWGKARKPKHRMR